MPQHTLARVTASPGRLLLRVSPHAPLGSPCSGLALALALARDCHAALPAPATSKGTKAESCLHTPTKVGGKQNPDRLFPKMDATGVPGGAARSNVKLNLLIQQEITFAAEHL